MNALPTFSARSSVADLTPEHDQIDGGVAGDPPRERFLDGGEGDRRASAPFNRSAAASRFAAATDPPRWRRYRSPAPDRRRR